MSDQTQDPVQKAQTPDPEIARRKALLKAIRDRLGITKVVCTRSLKGKNGDVFVGFSARWNSVQDDGGQGLVHVADSEECAHVEAMTLKEAVISAHLVGLQTELVARQHAKAGGTMDPAQADHEMKLVQNNYGLLLSAALGEEK